MTESAKSNIALPKAEWREMRIVPTFHTVKQLWQPSFPQVQSEPAVTSDNGVDGRPVLL
jgi:hypothetical protein